MQIVFGWFTADKNSAANLAVGGSLGVWLEEYLKEKQLYTLAVTAVDLK